MTFPNPLTNKFFKYLMIAAASLILIYALLRLVFFPADPVMSLLTTLIDAYFFLAEGIANLLFNLRNAGVVIKDHEFIFENNAAYELARAPFLEGWPKFLLYRNWSALVLFMIWAPIVPIRKKLWFSLFFLLVHFFSVVSGLFLIGVTGPILYEMKPHFFLSPTLVGTLSMYILLAIWLKLRKNEIVHTLFKLKINFTLPDRKINEILVLFFILLLLRSFIVAFFDFPYYVQFLLVVTQYITSLFNHIGHISGDQLVGEHGTLAVSKDCLGFLTMFIFAAMIYITRPKNNKVTWLFITFGLIFLVIVNLIRLIVLFIVVQGEDGIQTALDHHDIYNYIIYALIFGLWVVWFEVFVGWKKKDAAVKQEN